MENSGATIKAVIITEQCDQRTMAAIASVFNIQGIREMILSYLSPRDLCALASVLSSAAIPKGPHPSIDRFIMNQGLMTLDRHSDLTSASADTIAAIIRKYSKHTAITYSANKSLKPDIEDRGKVVNFHVAEVVVSNHETAGSRWERFLARTKLSSFDVGTVGEGLTAVGTTGSKVFFIRAGWNFGRSMDDYLLIVYAPSYEKILDHIIGDYCFSREFITPVVHRVRWEHDAHKEPDFETSGGWFHLR
ncbi:hypothetical protein NX722_26685 [Endozoicomonas gorgoniicola]|uniref:Uncharacterized protein n=1 Tax=Endozoicomonas gorgoniicola TaxID=1234144 RepID=A0ABT3N3E3_9GAMM|nr:hypothetical protein [Endozoicomonas gorgoniicola]MCW7556150.1 hypothetical protein [Endozoicomonas gorgoniicola]